MDLLHKMVALQKVTGRQSDRALRWQQGFAMSYGGESGEASLTIRVNGVEGTFDVPLVLEKRQGRWNVKSAKAVNERGDAIKVVE